MSARAGMSELITYVRQNTNAGTADYTVAGVAYFTDDHIQGYLDQYRTTWKEVELLDIEDYENGTSTYTEYRIPMHLKHFERSGTASGWAVRDGAGSAAPSNTPNYDAGIITFAADTGGTAYYLNCRTYNVNAAIADVWEAKAGMVAASVDWSSDNHSIKASQESAMYMKLAAKWRAMGGGVRFVQLSRADEAASIWEGGEPDNDPPRSYAW